MLKRMWIFLVLFAMVFLSISHKSYAQTTDTFQITITVQYLAINLLNQGATNYTTWAIGSSIAPSSANSMAGNSGGVGDQGVQVDNTSNVQTKLQCRVSTEATNWTIGGSIGADTYKLEAEAFNAWQSSGFTWGTGHGIVVLTTSAQDIWGTMAASTDQYVYFRLTAPSSTSTPNQQTITVELSGTL